LSKKRNSFQFKELTVWQRSVEFANTVIDLSENLDTNAKHYRLIEQLESAVASISQNIAEGKGRKSKKEFAHFLYISRGSLYEVITLLNIFEKRSWISKQQLEELESEGIEIASMIKGLINAIYRSEK
jgi:four helix bundle protein